MKYLSLPDDTTRILPFYLAMEEYAARIMAEEDIFFMWQVEPTPMTVVIVKFRHLCRVC